MVSRVLAKGMMSLSIHLSLALVDCYQFSAVFISHMYQSCRSFFHG